VTLAPEDQLLLLLARGEISHGVREQVLALIRTPLNWQVVFQKAVAEEVYPLLHRNLNVLGFPHIPAEVRSQFHNLSKVNSLRNTLLTEDLVRVLTLLNEADIPAIPLKGVALAQTLYGDPALRACVDTDILIPPAKTAEALQLLRSQGYESEFKSGFFANVLLRHDIEYALRRKEREFTYLLELHWAVSWGSRSDRDAMHNLWAEASPKTIFGAPAYALSPEWEILFLAAHAARHQWQGLKWLVDLHELYSSPDIDWKKVKEKANRFGWDELLRITLNVCHTLFDTPAPPNFSLGALPPWLKIFPESPNAKWSDAFFATRFLKQPAKKLRYIGRVFLIPTLAEWRLLRLPYFLEFLYYPLRPLRLLCKWSGAFIRGGLDKLGLSTSN
jgi:Uncharacterised nucleotidyltransferase